MTIEKENKTALKEAFDAELLKQLEENPPEIPSYEKFSSMIDGEVKKRRRRIHIISTAASIALLFLAGIVTYPYFAPDIQADKNPKEEIITEDGVIIEDGGWGSSDGEDNVWVIDEWEHVYDARKVYDDFLIPEYVPEGYVFEKLIIEALETESYSFEYLYIKESESLEIEGHVTNEHLNTFSVGDVSGKMKTGKGDLFFKDDEKKAIIQLVDGQIVSIWGDVSNSEKARIIDCLH